MEKIKKSFVVQLIIRTIRLLYFFRYKKAREKFTGIKIESIEDTIKCLQEGRSLVRYGDGEMNLMFSNKSIGFQKYSPELQYDLISVLENDEMNYWIGIPRQFLNTNYDKWFNKGFWWSYVVRNQHSIDRYFNRGSEYLDSTFSRVITELKDKAKVIRLIDEIKAIWKDKNVIIIEGEQTRFGEGNDLMADVRSVRRILAPSTEAYDKIDDIIKYFNNYLKPTLDVKNTLVLVSLGPAATIVSARLSKYVQTIDIGHFDLQYEYLMNGKFSQTKVKNRYDNEAGNGSQVSDKVSDEYGKQIIYKVRN